MYQKVPDHLQYSCYVDGGVVLKNPSPLGGVWAWCVVDADGNRLEYDSGVVEPKELGLLKLSNNVMELYAVMQALEAMPQRWCGILHSDSLVTFYRLTSSYKFNGIPAKMRDRCLALRTGKLWTPMHVAGHPTREDLEVGYNKKGLPVSKHNVWCDTECRRQARLFLKRRERKAS